MPRYLEVANLLKIGQTDHIQSLREEGKIFFKNVGYFKDCEKENARFDSYENLNSIEQIVYLKLLLPDGKQFEWDKRNDLDTTKWHANKIEHAEENTGAIFCCTALHQENLHYINSLPRGFLDFAGTSVLIITNPVKFINKIIKELRILRIKFEIKNVWYYDKYKFEGDLTLFNKTNEYAYQSELRIYLKNINEDYVLDIGSIEDISEVRNIQSMIKNKANGLYMT